jgi:hypothetical protein
MTVFSALLLSHVVNSLVSPALAMSYEDYAAAPSTADTPQQRCPKTEVTKFHPILSPQ